MIFLARGRQCESEAFSTNVTQLCVTAEVAKGVVFYGVIGAGAPVVERRLLPGVGRADYSTVVKRCQVFSVTLGKLEELYSDCLKRRRKQY